jgi:hypothetical protein
MFSASASESLMPRVRELFDLTGRVVSCVA